MIIQLWYNYIVFMDSLPLAMKLHASSFTVDRRTKENETST
jgi:hypothetical protein